MDAFQTCYIIPVIIGHNKEMCKLAKEIYRCSGRSVHYFAESFTIFQLLKYKCHRVCSSTDHILQNYLIDFASKAEEIYTPVFILCDDNSRAFFNRCRETLEPYYIPVDILDLIKN